MRKLPARDRPLHAERVLAEELAVHHRHPPVAPPVELLAGLVAVPEEAEEAPDLHRLLAGNEPVEAGRGRARHHALADAVDQRLAERGGVEPEEQEAHSRPTVGRLTVRQIGLDADLGVATDHGGRVAARQRGRRVRPAGGLGGHDRAGRAHLERLREGVLDLDSVDPQHDGRLRPPARWGRGQRVSPLLPPRVAGAGRVMTSPPATWSIRDQQDTRCRHVLRPHTRQLDLAPAVPEARP